MAEGVSRRVVIVIEEADRTLRLSTLAKWRRAVLSGDLKPDTPIRVETDGRLSDLVPAGEAAELAPLFGDRAVPADPPSAEVAPESQDPPPPVEEPVEPVSPTEAAEAAPASAPSPFIPAGPAKSSSAPRIGATAWVGGLVAFVLAVAVAAALQPSKPAPEAPPAPAVDAAAAPALPAVDTQPPQTLIEWRASSDGDPHVYAVGGLEITLHSVQDGDTRQPILEVRAPGSASVQVAGASTPWDPSARFAVGRFDPSAGGEEVLFSSFSGGAHCCYRVFLLSPRGDRWKTFDLGAWDGDGLTDVPKDIDGDGAADFVFLDDRFAYAFAPYAASLRPVRIFEVSNAEVRETSSNPRYASLFEKGLDEGLRGCREHSNGACAAFVADAARLGRLDWAWEFMLQNYDADSDWELPKGCRVAVQDDAPCPAGQELTYDTFPEALRAFLVQTGYITAPPEAGTDDETATATGE